MLDSSIREAGGSRHHVLTRQGSIFRDPARLKGFAGDRPGSPVTGPGFNPRGTPRPAGSRCECDVVTTSTSMQLIGRVRFRVVMLQPVATFGAWQRRGRGRAAGIFGTTGIPGSLGTTVRHPMAANISRQPRPSGLEHVDRCSDDSL